MHKIRGTLTIGCDVCGAAPGQECEVVDQQQGKIERAEFELARAIANLREVAPDHPLMKWFGPGVPR